MSLFYKNVQELIPRNVRIKCIIHCYNSPPNFNLCFSKHRMWFDFHFIIVIISREEPYSGVPSLAEQLLSSAMLESHNSVSERKIYQEFFADPHTCSPSLPGSLSFSLIPTISELRETINERAGLTVQGSEFNFEGFENAAGSKEWEYRIMKQEELFSGSNVVCFKLLTVFL